MGEAGKHYHPFAAAMCTISVFHMKSVLNVVSRHFGVAFNIPRHNVGIYASKLISYRFFLGMVGSALELILYKIVTRVCKVVHGSIAEQIGGAIQGASSAIQGAIGGTAKKEEDEVKKKAVEIAQQVVADAGVGQKIGDLQSAVGIISPAQATQIVKDIVAQIIKEKAKEIAQAGTGGDAGAQATKIAGTIKTELKADKVAQKIADEFRKGISMISFILMIICRVVFLRKLYSSTNLGYHAYTILNAEGLSWGVVQMTLFPLTPMHSAVTTMSIDVSTMTIFFFQLTLDAFLFHRPLYMIKIEMWIIVFWNLVSIPIWLCSIYGDIVGMFTAGAFYNYDGTERRDSLWSPYWMFPCVSLLKDYMFPGVIPYALLTPDQAHLTNIVFPPFYILGSIIVIVLDETDKGYEGWFGELFSPGDREMNGFKEFERGYHAFWVLYIPQVVNYYYAHKAIHTTGAASKFILGNRGFVLFMAIVMQLGYSILESLSFVCVANYTFTPANQFNTIYLETHNLMAEVYRFIFSKTSVGYNNLRNRYGLGMNVVHPHRLRPPGAGYWIKQSCAIAYKDTMNDMRMNIGDYL